MAEGRSYRSTGRFAEAVKAFERAAHEAEQLHDLERQAFALASASACQIRLFEYGAALKSSAAARDLALGAADSTLAGVASINLSTIYLQLGDFTLAKKEAETSVDLLRSSPRKDHLAKALLNYADIRSDLVGAEAGRPSYAQAITVARDARKADLEALAQDHLGTWLLLQGRLPEAEAALNSALDIRLKTHDEDGLAITKEHLAELELRKDNPAQALRLINEAFASSSPLFKTTPRYYPLHIRGRILLALGRKREALAEFRRAVDSATRWRQGALPGDATSTRTVAYLHDVYQDYTQLAAELALENRDPVLTQRALETLAENRAAALREQATLALGRNLRLPPRYFELVSKLQEAQARVTLGEKSEENGVKLDEIRFELYRLENEIGLEKQNSTEVPERNPHKNSLKDIQERLSDNEVLLSFCLGERQSFLWAVTEDQVNLYELPRESEIANQAKVFSAAVQSGRTGEIPGQGLSTALFGKLDPKILQKHDWLITSDGVLLNSLPFSALPAPAKQNLPLIADHTLRFLPSELLLAAPKAARPEQLFIGVADPIYNLADARRAHNPIAGPKPSGASVPLARLVASGQEVRSAAKVSGISDIEFLTGSQASSSALRKALIRTPEVLHFAVHIVSPDKDPQQAALALSLTNDNMPELLTSEAIATYRVPGTLVVLSGCSSGTGEVLPSAGLIGLSRSWLLAGASAVIVSAWPTPDDSGRFFSDFYSHFQTIKSGSVANRAAVSLKEAELDMRRSTGYRSSPSFWAAYSMISKE